MQINITKALAMNACELATPVLTQNGDYADRDKILGGLTKREHFALEAFKTIGNPTLKEADLKAAVMLAVDSADLLLEYLDDTDY